MPHSVTEKIKILLVDDNPAVLKLLGTLFEENGMIVTLALSAAEAKAALNAQNWDFDLVLSDISMPRETGFDLLSWIKREDSPDRDMPVLLTTAHMPEAENRLKGLSLGAVDYVVRPIDLPELVIRARHAIENFKRVRSLELSLQDSESFAMMGRLLAASHHEIKNIANLVSIAAEQAVKYFASGADEHGKHALKNLAQATELLTDISRNVGNLLQPDASQAKPINLNQLVQDIVSLLQSRVRPCRIEAKLSPKPIWAMAHSMRVKQVVINLILNANDSIAELDADGGGAIFVAVTADGDKGSIKVIDNGIGFDAPKVRSEFKAFSTTKKLRGGQGLGLWLCSTFMQNMGGKLTLRSEGVGKGAEAALTLKCCAEPCQDDLDISKYLEESL